MRRAAVAAALLLPLALAAQQTPRDYLARFDRNGDGRVSQSEYVAYMSRGFLRLDRNGDGRLDATELPPGPRRSIRTLTGFRADLRHAFHRLDRNRDGALDAVEFARPPG